MNIWNKLFGKKDEPASLPQSTPVVSPAGTAHVPAAPAKPVAPALTAVDPTDPLSRRKIRVFISSTFRDMQEERELLVKKVFPELRQICDERFVSFTEVDLRWGITEEEAAEGKVLPICLEEIHTCRPYFIGILGERYGWIPDIVPQEVIEKEPWIQEHIGHRTSVTELEILHGVLRNPKMDGHAFFYFRDPAYAANRGADFQTENPDSDAKLAALKETIRHSGRPLVDPYKQPEDLADAVKQQFIELIDQLYPKEQVPDPLDQEAIGHRSHARRKLLAYVDRPSHSQALSAFVAAPFTGQGLVVTGDSGGGKTALLAAFASSVIQQNSSFVFEHYFGATPDSASVDGFLRRLLGELKRLGDIKDEMPTTSEKMREALPLWLAQTSAQKPIVLVLDALNQIQGDEADRHLNWLPRFFPAHVRVVASSLLGPELDALRERGWVEHLLPLADTAERGRMIDNFLEIHRKQLGEKLRGRVMNAAGTANPLFLRTVLEELRQFGSFEKLPDQVAEYLNATTPQDLFRQVIQRWQRDFHAGRDIVTRSLRHLWAARQGLSENEWLDLLSDKSGPMDRQTWRPFLLAVEPHLVQRSSLWAFGHDYLKQAVEGELVPTEEKQQQAHQVLADYFDIQPVTPRTCAELPYQLKQGILIERLRSCLLDINRFLLIKMRNEYELIGYWVWLKEEQTMGRCYLQSFERWAADKGKTASVGHAANELGVFLSFRVALYAAAEPMLRLALHINEGIFGHNHSTVAIGLNSLAQLLQATNRLVEAEPLLRRALLINETCFGSDHPKVALILGNLAGVMQATNRLAEAEPLMRRALHIDETSFGTEHPKVARDLNNLALLLQDTNRLSEAESMLRRALLINETSFGSGHPTVASSLNNLAALFYVTKRPAEAEAMMRRALLITEATLGTDHPEVATKLNNLAQLLQSAGRLVEAESLMRRALLINESIFGKNHPMVGSSLNNLASFFYNTKRHADAEPLLRRALLINESSFGIDHPTVASSLNNLATLLYVTNRTNEAEPLMRRMVNIILDCSRATGHQHPDLNAFVGNYAALLRAMGKAEDDIREIFDMLGCRYGIDLTRSGGHAEIETSTKLRHIFEKLMQDQSKFPEIVAQLQQEDPALLMEFLSYIERQK